MTLAAGLMIVYSFWLFLVTLTFWVMRIDNLEQVMWQAFEAGRYPIDIYPRGFEAGLPTSSRLRLSSPCPRKRSPDAADRSRSQRPSSSEWLRSRSRRRFGVSASNTTRARHHKKGSGLPLAWESGYNATKRRSDTVQE